MAEQREFRVQCFCCGRACVIEKDAAHHVILCCPFCGSQRVEVSALKNPVVKEAGK